MQTAHPHGLAGCAQQQRVAHCYLSGQGRPGHHDAGTGNAKGTIDGQAETATGNVLLNFALCIQQCLTQGLDTLPGHARQHDLLRPSIGPGREQRFDLDLNRPHPCRVHPVALADRHQRPRDPQQLDDRQMLAGLRHHPIIRSHHQQHQVNALNTGEHVVDEALMTGHVNKTGKRRSGLQHRVNETQVDGDATLALFPAAVT